MRLVGGGGVSKSSTPSFAVQQTFATGSAPVPVTTTIVTVADGAEDRRTKDG